MEINYKIGSNKITINIEGVPQEIQESVKNKIFLFKNDLPLGIKCNYSSTRPPIYSVMSWMREFFRTCRNNY